MGWYCGVGDFGLTWCKSLSPSLALQTFFNIKKIQYMKISGQEASLVQRNAFTSAQIFILFRSEYKIVPL